MIPDLMQYASNSLYSLSLVIMAINAILHFIFAGAVARDAGQFEKRGFRTHLVSGITWAFATLIGGVFVAAIYWFMHHFNPPKLS